MKTRKIYSKEITRAVKENGKVIGWNVVRLLYDQNDKNVGEQIIAFINKQLATQLQRSWLKKFYSLNQIKTMIKKSIMFMGLIYFFLITWYKLSE